MTPGGEFSGGTEEEFIKYAAADPDRFGSWTTVIIRGTSVEIPLNDEWNVEVIRDPCFGDARYYVVLEEIATKDRIKVDLVDPKVLSTSADPSRLEGVTERILRTIQGAHDVPESVKTFGPLPTMVFCEADPEAVPTLSPDNFTPPVTSPEIPAGADGEAERDDPQ